MRAVESIILIGALATIAQMSTGCNDEVERIKKTSDMTLMQDNDSSKNQGYTVTPVVNGVPASSGLPEYAASSAGKTNPIGDKLAGLQERTQLPDMKDKLGNMAGQLPDMKDKLGNMAGNDIIVDAKNKATGKLANFLDQAQNLVATTPRPSFAQDLKAQAMDKAMSLKDKLGQVALGQTTPKPSTRDIMGNALKDGVRNFLK